MSRTLAVFLLFLPTLSWAEDGPNPDAPWLEYGQNRVAMTEVDFVDGMTVILDDILLPAGAQVGFHTHSGQEVVYVLEGSAIHRVKGKEDVVFVAGETFVIPTGQLHAATAGPEGIRGLVIRLHMTGKPVTIFEDEQQAIDFVDQAIADYVADPDATIKAMRGADGPYRDGESYVFILDADMIVVAHGSGLIEPGTETLTPTGSDGPSIGEIIRDGATAEGSWVTYDFVNPETGAMEPKRSWLKSHDGLIFGSGVYD